MDRRLTPPRARDAKHSTPVDHQCLNGCPLIFAQSRVVASAASFQGGGVAPGEFVAILGSFAGPANGLSLQLTNQGIVSTNLGGMEVLFNGNPAPRIYAAAGQVNCVVPYEVSGLASAQVQVSYQGQLSNTATVPVTKAAPAIFTLNSQGQGAILNQDGTINSPSNPAALGSIVQVFATGEGQTTPAGVDGTLDGSPAPQPAAQPVTAMIGGVPANVTYAGA